MMKKYILLKDSHPYKAGDIFESKTTAFAYKYFLVNSELPVSIFADFVETSPEWFEEVQEPKNPKRKAPAYIFERNNPQNFRLSTGLFSCEAEAFNEIFLGISDCSSTTFEWPALPDSEGYYPGPKVEG